MDLFVLTDLIGYVGAMTEMDKDKTSLIRKIDFNKKRRVWRACGDWAFTLLLLSMKGPLWQI